MDKIYKDSEDTRDFNKNHDNIRIILYNERKRRAKLKRKITKGVALGLSACLAFGGVTYYLRSVKKENTYDFSKDYLYQSSPISTKNYIDSKNAFEIEHGEDPVIEKKYSDVKIKINQRDYESYIKYIKSLDSNYRYEDLYNISEAIKKYRKNNKNISHKNDITNRTGILTSDILYERVKDNNKTLFDRNNTDYNSSLIKLSNGYIKEICDVLVESINNEINNNPNIDKKELFCILSDLKITGKSVNFNNASFNEDNLLVVDKENIKNYQFFNKDIDAFRQVITHEANHIIQSACNDNEEIGEFELGICHKYDDLTVNSFYWSWFLEAAAEKAMGRALEEDTNTYSAAIGYYDSLILCSILNKGVKVSDVENISFDKKTENLFKAFNAQTSEEKIEIIKMMYSIEIMQSKPQDFYKVYNEATGIDLNSNTEELENLRLSLRIDILKTLSKQFYKSLSYQLLSGNLTLDTIYYLINVYESDVFIHLFYNEKERIKSGVEFFDFYTELQDMFFKLVERSVNYDYSDIISMFNNYSMNVSYNGNTIKNYNIDMLGDENANFIEKKRNQNYQTGIPTIRSMPLYCIENGYSK